MFASHRLSLSITTAALAFSLFAHSAHANLVTNGSFESTNLSGKGYFASHVTGWSGGSNLTFLDYPGTADDGSYLSVYKGFPTISPDGGNFIEADGDPSYSGAFYQDISGLTVGQSYTLNFYQAAGQQLGFTGPTTERWSVTLGNSTQLSSQYSLPQGATGAWEQQTMNFIATAATETLTFLAVGTPNGAPPISFLDGVDLEVTTPAHVPEPGTWTLLGAGVAALGIFKFARKNRA